MTIHIGIIGGNFGVRVHLPAFRRDPRCVVWGLWSRKLSRTRRLAQQHQIPFVYRNWGELLRDPRIDAVAVALPPHLQSKVAARALALGKPCFLEKPLSSNYLMAKKLLHLIQRHPSPVIVDFEFPELSSWQLAKKKLQKKELGRLKLISAQWILPELDMKKGTPWKHNPRQGGGLLANFGSHVLNYMEWFAGPIREIKASMDEPRSVELWMKNQQRHSLYVRMARVANEPKRHEINFVGEKGVMILENSSDDYVYGFELRRSDPTGRYRMESREKKKRGISDGRIVAVSSLSRRFITGVLQKKKVSPSLEAGVRTEELMQAAKRSVQIQKWVKVA